MRTLIIEGDLPLSKFLRETLEAKGYAVDVVMNGEQAQHLTGQEIYDLVILDLNLAGNESFDVLEQIRNRNVALPILALTPRSEVKDRVEALERGADDCLPKPFAVSELLARCRALLRRSKLPGKDVLRVEDLELKRAEREVNRSGKPIELTPKELSLLEYLMQNSGRCVTRAMIMEHVWRINSETMTNVVDVYVNYLRKKVDGGFERKLIRTVRGTGYQIGAGEGP